MKTQLKQALIAGGMLVALIITIEIGPSLRQPVKPLVQETKEVIVKTVPDVINEIRSSVVHVKKIEGSARCQGSGVVVAHDIIMTARHVTDGVSADNAEYTLTLDDGRELKVTQVIEDRDNDLAFFQVTEANLVPIKLADENPVVGEMVIVFGSPLGYNNINTASPGYVTALNRDRYNPKGWDRYRRYEWHQMIQSNAPAFPGNSGGPVFNLRSEIVGILVAGQDATLNFSVPVSRFRDCITHVGMLFKRARYEVLYYAELEPEDYLGAYGDCDGEQQVY